MSYKKFLLPVFLLFIFGTVSAQMKIGYTNLEKLLYHLTEKSLIPQSLSTYESQLSKQLETKKDQFNKKYQVYAEKAQHKGTTPQELSLLEKELTELQDQLQKESKKAEQKLVKKQNDLMAPLLEKVDLELKKLAQEKGYTYILNSRSGGSSIIIKASSSDDITEELLSRLGISIEKN